MWGIIIPIVATIIAGLTTAVVLRNWEEIREEVKEWLHEQGLNESILMDVWIEITMNMDIVHKKIIVKTIDNKLELISEKTYSRDEIDDSDVIKELQKRGVYREEITEMFV